jgi:dephospho-CoA kinase
MNKLIAITGGIGSGKSTALNIVEKLGYKTFNADLTYKELLLDEAFVNKVCHALNVEPTIIDGKKVLNKSAISQKVFNDANNLKTLNSITHPAIMNKMLHQAKSEKGLIFCEVPLLYEGNFQNLFDFVFIIKRNDLQRFTSVVKRDGKTIDQVEKIAKTQFDYTKIQLNKHTFIIENDGDVNHLMEKIKGAIEKIN